MKKKTRTLKQGRGNYRDGGKGRGRGKDMGVVNAKEKVEDVGKANDAWKKDQDQVSSKVKDVHVITEDTEMPKDAQRSSMQRKKKLGDLEDQRR